MCTPAWRDFLPYILVTENGKREKVHGKRLPDRRVKLSKDREGAMRGASEGKICFPLPEGGFSEYPPSVKQTPSHSRLINDKGGVSARISTRSEASPEAAEE